MPIYTAIELSTRAKPIKRSTIKIGMLGAADIGNWGLIEPAKAIDGVEFYSVAARDRNRAIDYAARYGAVGVHDSYESMLADPAIDAVYNPLPNALHEEWTIKALNAGKHVLCEKPFASNAKEARQMSEAADRNGKVLMEALHYRYHPMASRMQTAVAKLGHIRRIETNMCVPLFKPADIRYRYDLGGGAAMDVGAYTSSLLRYLAAASGEDALKKNPSVESVKTKLRSEYIDRAMKVNLKWDNGTTGKMHFSLWSTSVLKLTAKVIGEHGELSVSNPYLPHTFNRFKLKLKSTKISEKIAGEPTYTYQLREFLTRIHSGEPYTSDLSDTIATMELIDAIYDKAGLPQRGLTEQELRDVYHNQ